MKLKVGGGSRTAFEDAALVNTVVASSSRSHTRWLRLDANQSWTVDEFKELTLSLTLESKQAIEYIEEPLISFHGHLVLINDLCAMIKESEFPIALDESLLHKEIIDFLVTSKELKIVNKTFLHGIRDAHPVLREPKRTTITCTFESGIGLCFLVAYASVVNPLGYHGIHALPAMALCDPITKRFTECVEEDEDGTYVRLESIERVVYEYLDSY